MRSKVMMEKIYIDCKIELFIFFFIRSYTVRTVSRQSESEMKMLL